ncbi:L-threonylcarbamoyladenylate synthase [Nibrella saemangeumensis]|uniref:Threonylcarbamoyl-AMP synthase n=1 Tax=Nibrella saemangeumensis TaxID=1084526 RepID=A0ABP8NHK9_9BACT
MAQLGNDLQAAKQLLEQGEVVGIPTETVYGLAGNAFNPDAVLKIFTVKNRPAFDPLIVHTDSLTKVSQFVDEIPEPARKLAEKFWPGPLTLLLPKKPVIPELVTSGLSTVAVRIPNHPLTLALLRSLDFPLAAPSANPFGYISPTTAQHVVNQLGDQIPYVLDGGPCQIGLESTIIGFTDKHHPIVYRLGGMALETIEAVVGPLTVRSHSTSNPKAPGMLSSHYAPRKPLVLMPTHYAAVDPEMSDVGALAFQRPIENIPSDRQLVLSPTGDLTEAARNLFAYLRQLDQLDVDIIYAEKLPDEGLGRAINDRLRRAAVR